MYGKALETVFPSPPVGSSGVLGLGGGNNGSPFSFATQIGGNFGNQFSFCLPTTASTSFSTLDFGPDSMTSPGKLRDVDEMYQFAIGRHAVVNQLQTSISRCKLHLQ